MADKSTPVFVMPIHHRKTKFNERFNFDDKHPDFGFLQLSGEGCVNTKIEIKIKMYNPDLGSEVEVTHDDENFRYNSVYHDTIVVHGMKLKDEE